MNTGEKKLNNPKKNTPNDVTHSDPFHTPYKAIQHVLSTGPCGRRVGVGVDGGGGPCPWGPPSHWDGSDGCGWWDAWAVGAVADGEVAVEDGDEDADGRDDALPSNPLPLVGVCGFGWGR